MLLEVNAVARTVGYSHLAYARSDRLNITGIAEAEGRSIREAIFAWAL